VFLKRGTKMAEKKRGNKKLGKFEDEKSTH
jgi:hypothetical protein